MAKSVKNRPFQRDWKRDLLLAGVSSLLLAMVLCLYTFGFTSNFIFEVFNALLVIFILLAGTVFLIVPTVNWLFWIEFKKKAVGRKSFPSAPKRNLPKAKKIS